MDSSDALSGLVEFDVGSLASASLSELEGNLSLEGKSGLSSVDLELSQLELSDSNVLDGSVFLESEGESLSSLDVQGIHLDDPLSGMGELGHLLSADSELLFELEEALSDSDVLVSSDVDLDLSSVVSSPLSVLDLVLDGESLLSDDSEVGSLVEAESGPGGVSLDDSLPAQASVDSVESGELNALSAFVSSDADSLSWGRGEGDASSGLLSTDLDDLVSSDLDDLDSGLLSRTVDDGHSSGELWNIVDDDVLLDSPLESSVVGLAGSLPLSADSLASLVVALLGDSVADVAPASVSRNPLLGVNEGADVLGSGLS